MQLLTLLISIAIFTINAIIGFFLCYKPYLSIEIQKKFYEKINWRIEPISMQKEIRNTRIMGLFLIIATLLAIAYVIIKVA